MAFPLLALLPVLDKVFDRVLPNKEAAAEAKFKIMEMHARGELAVLDADTKLAAGQLEINKVEAGSGNWFAASWRPFIGWTCGAAFAWNWVLLPAATFAAASLGHAVVLSPADLSEMMPVLLGMLGLGTLRTVEKIKGVAAGRERVI